MQRDLAALIGLAFSGSIGMMFLVLSCALPQYGNWWPFFLIAFYLLATFPIVLSRRYSNDSGSSPCKEMATFITAVIVISAFAFPIILARASHSPDPATASVPIIEWGAAGLAITANIIVFVTILGFFVTFDNDEVDYSMW
nr:EOG090X0J87 [Sida crystallina]